MDLGFSALKPGKRNIDLGWFLLSSSRSMTKTSGDRGLSGETESDDSGVLASIVSGLPKTK
jgi:hypothetical protein